MLILKEKLKFIKGFTLIELLIVVTLIGILAGATISVINLDATKEKAKDGVRRANMEKIVSGLETFYAAEGFYPDKGSEKNPLTGTDATLASVYIKTWPGDSQDIYEYSDIDSDTMIAGVLDSNNNYLKYYSGWSQIQVCSTLYPDGNCTAPGSVPPATTSPPAGTQPPAPTNPPAPTEPPAVQSCTINSQCQSYCNALGCSTYRCTSLQCACSACQ